MIQKIDQLLLSLTISHYKPATPFPVLKRSETTSKKLPKIAPKMKEKIVMKVIM